MESPEIPAALRITANRLGLTLLTPQETNDLADILRHAILPSRFDSLLRKLGVHPEGVERGGS